jgi:hypothetical protein
MSEHALKSVSKASESVDQARLSRAKTQHALEQNRKTTRSILSLLAELRSQQNSQSTVRSCPLESHF